MSSELVTPSMIKAGAEAYFAFEGRFVPEYVVKEMFLATLAAKGLEDQIDAKSPQE